MTGTLDKVIETKGNTESLKGALTERLHEWIDSVFERVHGDERSVATITFELRSGEAAWLDDGTPWLDAGVSETMSATELGGWHERNGTDDE